MMWALVVVVGVLLADRVWQGRRSSADQRLLIEAVLSRHAPDLALLERSARKPKKPSAAPKVFDMDGNEIDPRDQAVVGLNGN